uniref:Glycosyltransferase 61 catalytic domain-containing protein n=1 Tax=Guillardia theta TaxID=55529 RepID=A0A7S4NUV9_GUITH
MTCTSSKKLSGYFSGIYLYHGSFFCDSVQNTLIFHARSKYCKGRNLIPHLKVNRYGNLTQTYLRRNVEVISEKSLIMGILNYFHYGHFMFNSLSHMFDILHLHSVCVGQVKNIFLFLDAKFERVLKKNSSLVRLDLNPMVYEAFALFGVDKNHFFSARHLFALSNHRTIFFRDVILGLNASSLDHYNYRSSPIDWRLFRAFIIQSFHLNAIRLDKRSLLVNRTKRRLLNPECVLNVCAEILPEWKFSSVSFEGLSLMGQLEQVRSACLLIGLDGTGLFNGVFMDVGCIIVRIKPIYLDVLVPGKSKNFERLWRNVGMFYDSVPSMFFNVTLSIEERDMIANPSKYDAMKRFRFGLSLDAVVDQEQLLGTVERLIGYRYSNKSHKVRKFD